jgi:hypothetical protein
MDLRAEQNINGTVYLELSSPSTELQKIIGNDGQSHNGRAVAPGHPKFRTLADPRRLEHSILGMCFF